MQPEALVLDGDDGVAASETGISARVRSVRFSSACSVDDHGAVGGEDDRGLGVLGQLGVELAELVASRRARAPRGRRGRERGASRGRARGPWPPCSRSDRVRPAAGPAVDGCAAHGPARRPRGPWPGARHHRPRRPRAPGSPRGRHPLLRLRPDRRQPARRQPHRPAGPAPVPGGRPPADRPGRRGHRAWSATRAGAREERNLLDDDTLARNVAAIKGQIARVLGPDGDLGAGRQPRLDRGARAARLPARRRQARRP